MVIFLAGKELGSKCTEPPMRPHPRDRNKRFWHHGTSMPRLDPSPGESGTAESEDRLEHGANEPPPSPGARNVPDPRPLLQEPGPELHSLGLNPSSATCQLCDLGRTLNLSV